MAGKRKSKVCQDCNHHPTKRVYLKVNGIFRGIAWVCNDCRGFTWDDGSNLI